MTRGPGSGLPPRIYLPIVVVSALVFLGIVGYFLRIGLGVTGSALGPIAQQGDSQIQATAAPGTQDEGSTPGPGEVVVPQSGGIAPAGSGAGDNGGAANGAAGAGNGVGGGTPAQAPAGAPPAPVQRLLTDLRGRLAQNPRDLSALVGLAQLYFDAGKFDQAAGYYTRALAIDPANPDTRTDYATCLHATGEDLAALGQLSTVLEAQPNFAPALFNEGVVASSIGRRTQAIAAFHKFLKVAPQDQHAEDARTALRTLGG
ncbi:MAG: tetratricopeptide repeat protein [Vulcanimicrobiaceae bacterium]